MSDRVTLDDLESKLRDIGGSATSAATQATAPALGAAAVAGVLVVAAVYLLGRRRGRKEAPVLEIRRI
ncbi:MAG TPA: hypothetical protein VKA05_08090 [Acidimicrobiales bacterium]|nr:hypothetical protein [Acidimicrobiales bacterium]